MEMEQLAALFEAVKVIPLRPSDILVFRASSKLPEETRQLIQEALAGMTGHERVIVLDAGAELEVLRLEEEEPKSAAAGEQAAAPPPRLHRPVSGPAVEIAAPAIEKHGTAPGAIA